MGCSFCIGLIQATSLPRSLARKSARLLDEVFRIVKDLCLAALWIPRLAIQHARAYHNKALIAHSPGGMMENAESNQRDFPVFWSPNSG